MGIVLLLVNAAYVISTVVQLLLAVDWQHVAGVLQAWVRVGARMCTRCGRCTHGCGKGAAAKVGGPVDAA
jgi:MinD superfamily P-loop ATPase